MMKNTQSNMKYMYIVDFRKLKYIAAINQVIENRNLYSFDK